MGYIIVRFVVSFDVKTKVFYMSAKEINIILFSEKVVRSDRNGPVLRKSDITHSLLGMLMCL